jgi:hypothetical protein
MNTSDFDQTSDISTRIEARSTEERARWEYFQRTITALFDRALFLSEHSPWAYLLPRPERNVDNSTAILERNLNADVSTFVDVLRSAAEEWATPQEGEFGRPAIPFRVVFHCEPDQHAAVQQRLDHAGVQAFLLSDP